MCTIFSSVFIEKNIFVKICFLDATEHQRLRKQGDPRYNLDVIYIYIYMLSSFPLVSYTPEIVFLFNLSDLLI